MQFIDSYSKMATWIEFPDVIIKHRKLKLILRIAFSLMIICNFVLYRFTGYSTFVVSFLTLSIFGLIVIFLLTSKYYDWPVILFIMVLIGLVYKRYHWQFSAEFMAMGTTLLATISWYNAFKFLYTFRRNSFLKWFGFLSGVIIVLFMLGFLWMNMHWPGSPGLIGSGSLLFVFSVFALTFILPFSNYVSWSEIERKVFFRTVLTPMIFILVLFTLLFVFPEIYNSITGRYIKGTPWGMWDIDLLNLQGI